MAKHRRAALILGSSKGLGKELARELRADGFFVLEAARSFENSHSETGATFHCDLEDLQSIHTFLSNLKTFLKKEMLEIDSFFWNAGVHAKRAFAEHSETDILRLIDTNFKYPLLIVRYVWKEMQGATTPKTFVTIASTSGIKPRVHETVYAATKWAQVGFTRSLGLENTNKKIRVVLILPGGMQTELYKNAQEPADFQSFLDPQKVAKHILKSIEQFEHAEPKQEAFELEIPRGSL